MRTLTLLLLTACASGPANVPVPEHRKPKSSAKVYAPKGSWTIKDVGDLPNIGKTSTKGGVIHWDLEGAILDGKNQKGKCDQSEDQEPIFRARMPLVVKNGFVRNGKNGATFYAPKSGVEKMTWLNVCEDAVATSKGAYDFVVRGSEFINGRSGDKSLQLNEARGAIVEDNLIFSGITCMRIGDSGTTSTSETAAVRGNRFVGCRTAVNASKITVKESGNKYESVNEEFVLSNGAVRK